jgi:ABC-2 type transport system permease protein
MDAQQETSMSALAGLAHRVSVFVAIARQSFLVMLNNRLRFYTGVLTYLVYIVVYASIWRAVYAIPRGEAALADFRDYTELFTYIAVGWLARSFLFNNLDRDLSDLILSGDVTARCMRPVGLHLQMVAAAFGECLFRAICFTPLIALVLVIFYDIAPPKDVLAASLFAISLLLGVFVLAETNYLVGLIAFRTESIQGIIRAKQFLLEMLSGLLVPFSYFPDWVKAIAHCTPFPALTAIPNRIYIGKVEGLDALPLLGFSLAWCIGLATAAQFLTRRAERETTGS